jgi:hypothetical protein
MYVMIDIFSRVDGWTDHNPSRRKFLPTIEKKNDKEDLKGRS